MDISAGGGGAGAAAGEIRQESNPQGGSIPQSWGGEMKRG